MEKVRLERDKHYTINVFQADRLHLWESFGERENLTFRDQADNEVLTVFKLTHDQLAELYLEIACVLGKSPEPTLLHLMQIRERIDRLIEPVKPQVENYDSEL